ncbi:MAG: aminotransferase class V-fold PLP-dependent enzyme [Clostridia bacterium]|nr:aminotransferase class V-fold PLP-dependent enzyme [Clostridia bacterium]
MKTPICDFVNEYVNKKSHRLHVPGHKGSGFLGVEKFDITEIDGADDLYCPSSIILESEENASKIYNCPTYYTTEGSSHAIRAMVYLVNLYAKRNGKSTKILATRNVHKSFLTVTMLLDIDVDFINTSENGSYLSSNLNAEVLDNYLKTLKELPCALYITSPDYLGNTADIKEIKKVLNKYDIYLLVDNAHGAYLKFLDDSLFPIDLGADMCASSAHKTLPVLTGGAYLHLSNNAYNLFKGDVLTALTTFGSTSPSYLTLQSLDYANKILSTTFKGDLKTTIKKINELKVKLKELSYTICDSEPLKITIKTKPYGYLVEDFIKILYKNNTIPEFYDTDYIVLSFSPSTDLSTYDAVYSLLKNIDKKESVCDNIPKITKYKKALSIKDAIFSKHEIVDASKSENKIYADINIHCPPAVPIVIPGEIITKEVINTFIYYNIDKVKIVKQ